METSKLKKQFESLQEIAEKCDKHSLYSAALLPNQKEGDIVVRKWTNYKNIECKYQGYSYRELEGVATCYQLGVYFGGEVYSRPGNKYTMQENELNEFSKWLKCPIQDPVKDSDDMKDFLLPEYTENVEEEVEDDFTPVVLTRRELQSILDEIKELKDRVQWLEDNVGYRDTPWEE